MSTLANLMVGLGYDLSALEKGSPEAFRLINQQTLGMSAEMKRSSREGAESFRLIDEALGIHVSRPLTRILTQEFPGLAKALQSVIGVGIVGALGAAGVEGFEKIARGIEHAEKAEQEFQESTRRAAEVFDDAMRSYEKADKLRSLTGLDKTLFQIDSSSIDEGRKKIDELAAAMEKAGAAAVEAKKWYIEFGAAVGEALHQTFSSEGTLGSEAISKQFQDVMRQFDELSKNDALKGTRESAKLIADQLAAAKASLESMKAANAAGQQVTGGDFESGFTFSRIYSQQELDAQKQFIDNLEKENQLLNASAKTRTGDEGAAKYAAAVAAETAAHQELVKDFQEDAAAYNAAANALWQVAQMEEKLRDSSLAAAADRFREFQKINGSTSTVAPPAGAPERTDQAELEKVSSDQNEAWKKAGQILDQIETPLEKYQTGLAILKVLHDQGRISADQLTAAEAQLGDKFTEAELHLQEMQKQLEKLLSQSTSAKAGVQAFFLELQIQSAQNGKAAFDLLNAGLKGFEDQLTKAVFDGKAKWKDLFRSLAEEMFKSGLQKVFSGIFSSIGQTGLGQKLGLGSVGAAGQDEAVTANTAGLTANTAALTALTARLSMSSFGGAGDIGDLSDSGAGALPDIPGFASGTDSAPGGFAWVGEQGPELLNLPAGASVTPSSAARSGSDTHYYDMRGAVVTEDLMRKADFARAMARFRPAIVGEAVVNSAEVQRRTPKR